MRNVILLATSLMLVFAGVVLAQQEEPAEDAATEPTAESAAAVDEEADDAEVEDDEIDDTDLDLQTYEEDDDDFVPTEEIPADQAIPFPSDI